MSDPINPPHYIRGGIELGDVFEAWELGYWDGCAAKYIFRAKYKGQRLQDIEKAIRCLQKEAARLQKAQAAALAPLKLGIAEIKANLREMDRQGAMAGGVLGGGALHTGTDLCPSCKGGGPCQVERVR